MGFFYAWMRHHLRFESDNYLWGSWISGRIFISRISNLYPLFGSSIPHLKPPIIMITKISSVMAKYFLGNKINPVWWLLLKDIPYNCPLFSLFSLLPLRFIHLLFYFFSFLQIKKPKFWKATQLLIWYINTDSLPPE